MFKSFEENIGVSGLILRAKKALDKDISEVELERDSIENKGKDYQCYGKNQQRQRSDRYRKC